MRPSRLSARDLITPAALSSTVAVLIFVTATNAVFWAWDRVKGFFSSDL